jgi:hypothetical protein
MPLKLAKSDQQVFCDICGEFTLNGHEFAFVKGKRWRICSDQCAAHLEREQKLELPTPTSWAEHLANAKASGSGEIIITDAK